MSVSDASSDNGKVSLNFSLSILGRSVTRHFSALVKEELDLYSWDYNCNCARLGSIHNDLTIHFHQRKPFSHLFHPVTVNYSRQCSELGYNNKSSRLSIVIYLQDLRHYVLWDFTTLSLAQKRLGDNNSIWENCHRSTNECVYCVLAF